MTDVIALYRRGLAHFTDLVNTVDEPQWHAPTPCSEWNVRALVNHLAVEQLWAVPLLEGQTVQEVGDRLDGDQLGDNPVEGWSDAADDALRSFTKDGAMERTVHLSYGDVPAEHYLSEMVCDLAVHGWDLARAIGADDTIDGDLAAFCYEWTRPHADELAGTGLFGEPVPVSADASVQERLLAMYGRRP